MFQVCLAYRLYVLQIACAARLGTAKNSMSYVISPPAASSCLHASGTTQATYPLDTLRLRIAVDPGVRSIRGASAALLREGSYSAFFRGLTASLVGTATAHSIKSLHSDKTRQGRSIGLGLRCIIIESVAPSFIPFIRRKGMMCSCWHHCCCRICFTELGFLKCHSRAFSFCPAHMFSMIFSMMFSMMSCTMWMALGDCTFMR